VDILLIGGTSFVGRHTAEAASARGHRLTFFHRGQTGAGLFRGSEHVYGDRDNDLGLLRGRSWDAAVDVCAYLPRHVEQATDVLAGAVERYCYVSTVSAYKPVGSTGFTECSALFDAGDLVDPRTEVVDDATYGPLKALGDIAARRAFGARALIVRPTYVIGPDDISDRFAYWVRRASASGAMLAVEPADAPIQLTDVRDLGAFVVDLLEQEAFGAYNVAGPTAPLTWGQMLATCIETLGSDASVTWVDPEFLRRRGVRVESEIPFWRKPEEWERLRCDLTKSSAAGLSLRPLEESIRDTWAWDRERSLPPLRDVMTDERESELLAAWRGERVGRADHRHSVAS
jgi:2'-hydroxyisoflavone reductase